MKLVFSRTADDNLVNILQYGHENFGPKAAAAYEDSFRKAFQFISETPSRFKI